MGRVYVEEWSPEYGAPVEPDDALAPAEGEVDTTVEVGQDWQPIDGADDNFPVIAFVDGIRRVDARLVIDEEAGPVPGICGSLAAGAALWRRERPGAEFGEARVHRLAIFANGRDEPLPPLEHGLSYRSESIPVGDPAMLVSHFHSQMRRVEAEIADELADAGYFVVADGPLNELAPRQIVGYVKSHRVSYLPPEVGGVIGRLRRGQRTPLFTLPRYSRYSWYVRLADVHGGHSWSGIARCEAAGSLSLADVKKIAGRTAAVLPLVGSESHIDPRAPQNLVPIGALERELRRRLGDPGLVYRALRAATMRQEVGI